MIAVWNKRGRGSVFVLCLCLCLSSVLRVLAVSYEELIFDVQRYGNTPEKREAKRTAREELFARGPDALHEMMKRIHFENVMIGVFTQELLDRLEPEESAPVLVGFLDAPYARTRRVAAYFLGFRETPQYADRVMPLLDDEETAGAAIRTLGKWKIKDAVPLITPYLSHERETRRIAAANALRDIGDPSVIPALQPLLEDPIFTVRHVAARAIHVLSP